MRRMRCSGCITTYGAGSWQILLDQARSLRRFVGTVYYLAHDSRTHWFTRLLALLVSAYALSPVGLIPDFIPMLGYLDDLVVLPIGILLLIWLTPKELWSYARAHALDEMLLPRYWSMGLVIQGIWTAVVVGLVKTFGTVQNGF